MTFKHLLIFSLFAAVIGFARAQTPPPAKSPPFEFRITAWNLDLPGLFYEQDGKKLPTPLVERSLSPTFTFVSPAGKLVLYTQTLVEGAPVKTPLAEVTLVPPPAKNLVLIWHEKSGRFGAAVLADDPLSPPPGYVRFVNLSGQNLALQCSQTNRFTLAPGADKIVPPTNGGVGVGVRVARQRKKSDPESWELAMMSAIRISPNERITAFIADPERLSLSARKKSIVEHLDKEMLTFFIITDTVTK